MKKMKTLSANFKDGWRKCELSQPAKVLRGQVGRVGKVHRNQASQGSSPTLGNLTLI